MLHGALLHLVLWLPRLTQTGLPGTPGGEALPERGRVVQLVPLPAPGLRLSPWGGVVSVVVVVVNNSSRIIIVRGADLSEFCFVDFRL